MCVVEAVKDWEEGEREGTKKESDRRTGSERKEREGRENTSSKMGYNYFKNTQHTMPTTVLVPRQSSPCLCSLSGVLPHTLDFPRPGNIFVP